MPAARTRTRTSLSPIVGTGISCRGLSHASEPLLVFLHRSSEDVQNQTIIFDRHSTTLCSRVSIISSDRDHSSLLLQTCWTFLQRKPRQRCIAAACNNLCKK